MSTLEPALTLDNQKDILPQTSPLASSEKQGMTASPSLSKSSVIDTFVDDATTDNSLFVGLSIASPKKTGLKEEDMTPKLSNASSRRVSATADVIDSEGGDTMSLPSLPQQPTPQSVSTPEKGAIIPDSNNAVVTDSNTDNLLDSIPNQEQLQPQSIAIATTLQGFMAPRPSPPPSPIRVVSRSASGLSARLENIRDMTAGSDDVNVSSEQQEGPEICREASDSFKIKLEDADQRALDEAFNQESQSNNNGAPLIFESPVRSQQHQDQKSIDDVRPSVVSSTASRPRGLGRVHPDTPIPNCDVALRLLRKFVYKTRPKIATTYGGTKSRSILSYIITQKEDPTFVAYRDLTNTLFDGSGGAGGPLEDELDVDYRDDSDVVVDVVMGESGDSMARARDALARFVYLFSFWGYATSHSFIDKNKKGQELLSELYAISLDTSAHLVAHGCLDGVLLEIGDNNNENHRVVHILAQSVFSTDLTLERNELAAMKFLLTTGCRLTAKGDAMLRGTHLLQTIRIFYHIYLTTESISNKTTARAALQQMVTSVFTRVVRTDLEKAFARTADKFPSENHRDAFLVLRAICKLSMRNLPDPSSGMFAHVGLQVSGSNEMWDGTKSSELVNTPSPSNPRSESYLQNGDEETQRERAHLVYTAAIHPALESKLLALELLLYVLQNTDFSPTFIHRSGPQFNAAIRNYLCVSLLKNCTSDNTRVVSLSLRIFVPLMRNFRIILKNEIEAFVTNVFFVILDSKNSPAEHKGIVVRTFEELCSNPTTLAEIFLNYDCDLSAVDLFHRIVNSLSKVARTGLQEDQNGGMSFMGGISAARMEKSRHESRELRLDSMRALRQVLASLHASIVEPLKAENISDNAEILKSTDGSFNLDSPTRGEDALFQQSSPGNGKTLVEIYDSKKKRRAEESEVVLRFNQKPFAGIAYAAKCEHIDGEDAVDVAKFLLKSKDVFDKTQIGEYLGREAEYQNGFPLRVLHEYVKLLDFSDLQFDDAIRYFLSGFRLPGEAQKIDRIMEKFAERFTEQNPDVFPTADVAFILAFSIIMLNTDLHNPAIKEERRMTKEGFIRNNRGICDGKDLSEEMLSSIFDRIRANPISLKEDDEARERVSVVTGLPAALRPASFFSSHYDELDRARETNFQKERDHIVRTTESLLKRRRQGHDFQGKSSHFKTRTGKSSKNSTKFVRTEDSGLRDEYVSPMFEVTWGPALAAFSVAMESGNGSVGALISIASDEELEMAVENAAETIEVCLTGFKFAICTAGLCGNDIARDSFVLALSRFSQLGTGALLEPRHLRCTQTLMSVARDDGELLGSSWEYIFRALSEIDRFHQLFHLMARNDRVAAAAAERRRTRLEDRERRRREVEERRIAAEDCESISESPENDYSDEGSFESDFFSDDDDFPFEEDMDAKAIDEANARVVYYAVSEATIEAIYERSSTLSAQAVGEFVRQLCRVSKSEILAGGDYFRELTRVSYRQQHSLLSSNAPSADQFHHSQPNIYNLQKLVEVTHYNMESRPRLIFAELWSIVAEHLTGTALHSNPAIAMYAVDSFRQLSIQYLQRDELEVFEFQKRFLKPLEVVMARSDQTSTKELLLNCVDRIVRVFKSDDANKSTPKGGLKSGWVPILSILSLGGCDSNEDIANMSFKILRGEIEPCLLGTDQNFVLLSEHFVDTVNALLAFVGSQHEKVGREAIEQLYALAKYLADGAIELPQLRRKHTTSATAIVSNDTQTNQELEFWWPILLGLSRAVGDIRLELRNHALNTLFDIISMFFYPSNEISKVANQKDPNDEIQILQLVFRGVLFPILEHSELDAEIPMLPDDFDRFLTGSSRRSPDLVEESNYAGWMETMFDPFLDACIALCLRSYTTFGNDSILEEIFALLNICLLSDSGSLAVRGLQRLEQFITSDLDSKHLNDDIWATVAHMLRRCFAVRGLPARPRSLSKSANSSGGHDSEEAKVAEEKDYNNAVQDFLAEETHFPNRRYIGSNAIMVTGLLLSSDRFSIGLRWRLFLVAGLGRGIAEWDQAATVLASQGYKLDEDSTPPPEYYETAMYGRKWMNRFILQLASMKEIALAPSDGDSRSNKFVAGQRLVIDETQRLLSAFLKLEQKVSEYSHNGTVDAMHLKMEKLLEELLSGYAKMDSEHLRDISWINPILLESCIQSKNEEIRFAVQKLVKRTSSVLHLSSPIRKVQAPDTNDESDANAIAAVTNTSQVMNDVPVSSSNTLAA